MQSLLLLPIALALLAGARPTSPTVRTVFNFTDGTFLENIHATASGKLILTSLTTTSLLIVEPTAQTPQSSTLLTISDPLVNCITGIDEYAPGKFAVIGANLNMATFTSFNASVWKFDLREHSHGTITPQKVTDLPYTVLANGLAVNSYGAPATVLIANSKGSVLSVNVVTGEFKDVIQDDAFAIGTAGVPIGINGLHVRGSYLYFLNSSKGFAGRVRIRHDGSAAGPIETFATMPAGQQGYDDFALDVEGRMWIASHPNSVDVVFPESGKQVVLEAGLGDTAVGPTSAAFGRGSKQQEKTLYVTTGDGALLAFDTTKISLK